MALQGAAKRAIQNGADNHEPFKIGNVSGRTVDQYTDTGRLPTTWRNMFGDAATDRGVTYAIFSYATPIAWYENSTGKWEIPPVYYSKTTSNHQSVVRDATQNVGLYADAR